MKRAWPVFLLVPLVGCATVHPGEYAIPLDDGGRSRDWLTTSAGLAISSRELSRLATPSVGAVEVTFENRSPDWIHIGRIALDFQNETANQLVTSPADADAQAWASAVAQRDAIELTNRKNALAGLAVAGQMVAHIGGHHHHHGGSSAIGAIGAMVALGALIGLAATSVGEEVDEAEQVAFVPQSHLLVVPFAIPPGLFVRRWIALTTADPKVPCLTWAVLSYDTTAGQHERVRIRLHDPFGVTVWQRAVCQPRGGRP